MSDEEIVGTVLMLRAAYREARSAEHRAQIAQQAVWDEQKEARKHWDEVSRLQDVLYGIKS